jgi:hypothetical protein
VTQKISFSGKFGRAHVEFKNDLWRVRFDGRNDWYADRHLASRVALSLANTGKPPAGVESLLSKSAQKWSVS